MEKSYIGRIKSVVTQMVKAPIAKPSVKAPKVQSGGDLRARPSKKRG